jgi:drug/metabolite transporter (DMT)-like permease
MPTPGTLAPAAETPLEARDVSVLLALAAMWGIRFMFMRVVAPAIGWAWAADLRVAIGAALIGTILLFQRQPLHLARDWHHYALIGLINSAVPFALFAVAALHIPAAYSAIGNATAPLWGAMLALALGTEAVTRRKAAGLLLGLVGVAITSGAGTVGLTATTIAAFVGTLVAALLYAIAGIWMKTRARHIEPMALGCGSQLAATLWLLPALPFATPAQVDWSPVLVLCIIGSGVISTGLPYVLYFPLMRRIGVTRAMTVTFLVPCFAIAWAWLLLGERVGIGTIAGVVLVLAGVKLALGGAKPVQTA